MGVTAAVALRLEEVSKHVGPRTILHRVSLVLHAGRGLAIVGSNGSGKSTLLKVAAGIWGWTEGSVERLGRPVGAPQTTDPQIGYLGDRSFLYPHLTLQENLLLYGRLWGVDRVVERAGEAADRVGLSWCAHDLVRTYSRGMVQRASLARVWLTDPRLWILDEPESGLDRDGWACLRELLLTAKNRGCALLVATHQPEVMESCLDMVSVLDAGRFVGWGEPRHVSIPDRVDG